MERDLHYSDEGATPPREGATPWIAAVVGVLLAAVMVLGGFMLGGGRTADASPIRVQLTNPAPAAADGGAG